MSDQQQITAEAYIGEFYADFYFWVNLVCAAIQMFAVSRIMKYMGIGAALFFLPRRRSTS